MQTVYLLSLVYLSAQLVSNLKAAFQRQDTAYFCEQVVPLALMLAIWLIFLPIALAKYSIVTNIEMMKDDDIVEKVIAEQKLARAKRSQRVFQVMKLIRRELAAELRK